MKSGPGRLISKLYVTILLPYFLSSLRPNLNIQIQNIDILIRICFFGLLIIPCNKLLKNVKIKSILNHGDFQV